MARVPKLLDVSVPLAHGLPTYPGNPEFELQPIKRIADGGSSNVSRLVLGTHTGTLLGFKGPDVFQGLSVADYHLHFLSDDRAVGGHSMGENTAAAVAGVFSFRDAIRLVLLRGQYPQLPVVMITTQVQAADVKRAAEVGVDAHLSKPFDPDQLADTVARALLERAAKRVPGDRVPPIP